METFDAIVLSTNGGKLHLTFYLGYNIVYSVYAGAHQQMQHLCLFRGVVYNVSMVKTSLFSSDSEK